MPQWHGNLHKRKKSGGKKHIFRGKRAFEMGSDPAETIVGETHVTRKRGRGGKMKLRALSVNTVNVTDPATGKSQKTEIRGVIKNPANVDYQRRVSSQREQYSTPRSARRSLPPDQASMAP